MSDGTKIEWTDATWNPVRGCTKISPGCTHCYAATFAERFRGVKGHAYEQGFDLRIIPEKLRDPFLWPSRRRVFVNSMSDLFHADVPDEYIVRVARVMAMADWHTYQVLTKRSERMAEMLRTTLRFAAELPHVWWGVSVENRRHGLPRIDHLRSAPAAVRFLSVEPLLEDLGEVNLTDIHWMIVGGESGAGARPMQADWVRSLRDQCRAADVSFFFKQWGGVRKSETGRKLDLRTHDEQPADVSQNEMPTRRIRLQSVEECEARIISTSSAKLNGKERKTPMGTDNDRQHFEDYRAQTQVKHEILAAYLEPYFRIVGTTNDNLIYLDGFAGPGTYQKADTGETIDGSPLRALKLIAGDETFSKKVSTIFIEKDAVLHSQLENTVADFATAHSNIRKPSTACCTFSEGVRKLLEEVKGNLAPTFLFVDPCGVAGTSFETIKSVMACKSSEAFIFFNIDGVRRIAGLKELSNVLIELLGSRKRAETLFAALQKTMDVGKRERMILESYRQALRDDMEVKYTIPFRVESEAKEKTSHYLIHATNHHLGFKIMKDVMWSRGHSETGQGDLQFVQASRTQYTPLIAPNYVVKDDILRALATGPKCVNLFYSDWVLRPDDLLCQPAYKQALLELEASGEIEVLDKDGRTPKPVKSRRQRKGKPTLGEGYHVRLTRKPTGG